MDGGILQILEVLLFLLQTPMRRRASKAVGPQGTCARKCYSVKPNNPSMMLYERDLFSVCAVNNL